MINSNGRMAQGDMIAYLGGGFPSVREMHAVGTLASYVGNVDAFILPSSLEAERHGYVAAIADIQVFYATAGAGGSGNDVFRLQLIDGSADIAGTGTVSSSSTTVTGSGTSFTTTFAAGTNRNLIRVGNNTFVVASVTDDTHLTLEAAPASPWSGASFFRVPYIKTLATIKVPANTKLLKPVDLRNQLAQGIYLTKGQGLRIDVAGIGSGYSTTPASVRFRLGMELYGIVS